MTGAPTLNWRLREDAIAKCLEDLGTRIPTANMMVALSVLLLFLSLLLLGNAAVQLLRIPFGLCLPLGLSVLAIVVTTCLITADAPLDIARYTVLALTVGSGCFIHRLVANSRAAIEATVLVAVTFLVIILPAVIGGPQFFAFRGNWWDHFNYLAGMEAVAYHNTSAVRHLSASIASSDPITLYGIGALAIRPAAVLIAATFRISSADVFAYGYAYLALLLAVMTPTIAAACDHLRNRTKSRWLYWLIAISIPVGFWGQLLLDTSVWSHIAAMPLLASVFFLNVTEIQGAPFAVWSGRAWSANALLLFGAFLIYPEATVVVSIPLISASLIFARSFAFGVQYGALLAVVVFGNALIDFSGSMKFFTEQLVAGASKVEGNTSWFLYTFQPYFGFNFTDLFRDNIEQFKSIAQGGGPLALGNAVIRSYPSALLVLANLIPIVLGYYPVINGLAASSIVLGALASGLLLVGVGVVFVQMRHHGAADPTYRAVRSLVPPFLLLLAAFVGMAKIWEAGKALTFVMPLLLPLLFVLVLRFPTNQQLRNQAALALTVLFVAGSSYFAVARIWLARDGSGIGHKSPFPSVLRTDDKVHFRYALPEELRNCRGIVVSESHANRALYLLIGARQFSSTWFARPFSYYGYGTTTYPAPTDKAATCVLFFDGTTDLPSRPRLTPGRS